MSDTERRFVDALNALAKEQIGSRMALRTDGRVYLERITFHQDSLAAGTYDIRFTWCAPRPRSGWDYESTAVDEQGELPAPQRLLTS